MQTTVLERLQGRVYSGQQVQMMTTDGGARVQRGHLHFLGHGDSRFVFVCENDATVTFSAVDVIGISKTGSRITIK